MNYYYDLTLFFENQKISKFYEWELDDELIEVKKIPLFKIEEKNIINFIKYNGNINNDFLKKIKNKTTYKKDGLIKTILYAAIFTDTKFSIAILFDERGNIEKRSYLMLEDELNTMEIGYSLKKEKIIFKKSNKVEINNSLRQENKMKQYVKNEIDKLYNNHCYNELIYYYMEWFKKYHNDIGIIYKKMLEELNDIKTDDLNKIYELIMQFTK